MTGVLVVYAAIFVVKVAGWLLGRRYKARYELTMRQNYHALSLRLLAYDHYINYGVEYALAGERATANRMLRLALLERVWANKLERNIDHLEAHRP